MDQRHARALLSLAVTADARRGQGDESDAAELRRAADDIEPGIRTLLDHDPAAALQMVAALASFWQDEGQLDRGRELTSLVLERATAPAAARDTRRYARALAAARTAGSELAFRQGDQVEATALAQLALVDARVARDRAGEAMAWLMLARVAFRDGDADGIQAAASNALRVAGARGHTLARRGALHMLAWAAHTAGDFPEARRRFEASLAYRRAIGAGPLSEAVELSNLAELDLDTGDVASAAKVFAEVLETARSLDNRYLLVNTVPSAAAVADASGRFEAAAELLGALDGLCASTGLIPDPGGERPELRPRLEERLGASPYETAYERGRSRSEADAVELAIRICHDVSRGDGTAP